MTTTTKKITRSTIKSFINREMKNGNLFIKNESSFDGMVDCVMPVQGGFRKAEACPRKDNMQVYTLGVAGAWFVGQSRDHFTPWADDNFIGYEVYNCCGSFILAMGRRNTLSESDMNLLKQCDGVHDSVQDIINCKSCEVMLK